MPWGKSWWRCKTALRLPRCDSPTTYPVGLSYHDSRLSLFFRIANADILASRICKFGRTGPFGRGIVIAPHLDFCFRDAINRRLYRRIRFCKRHRFQSPSTFVETRFIASLMIHRVSPDSSCHPTPNTTNTNHHKFPTNFPLILRLPRCDCPTPYPVGLSYHGIRTSLFFRFANDDILAFRIANAEERCAPRPTAPPTFRFAPASANT